MNCRTNEVTLHGTEINFSHNGSKNKATLLEAQIRSAFSVIRGTRFAAHFARESNQFRLCAHLDDAAPVVDRGNGLANLL